MTKEAALYNFWSMFGITAYEENAVPSDAKFPYITYQVVTDSFGNISIHPPRAGWDSKNKQKIFRYLSAIDKFYLFSH